MDVLRADQLKPGQHIGISYPNQGPSLMEVESVEQVGNGPICGIYRIKFKRGGLDLMANGDREFEVQTPNDSEDNLVRYM